MVRKTFLKRISIPFGVASTAFLFTSINKAKAASLSEIITQKRGILINEKVIEGGGSWEGTKEFFEVWGKIGDVLVSITDWLINLPSNLPHYSVELLSKIYELLTVTVLHTPLFLFNNSFIKDTSLVFAGISILIVTILTMVEGIKKMLKKKNTDVKKILKRYSLSIVGAGFAPFLFEKSFELINELTKAISKIGANEISGFNLFSKIQIPLMNIGFLDTLLLLAFDVIVVALLIPIILQTGRRYWDLMCLSALTPLSLTAWIFDDYKHYFNKWWSNVKLLAQTQLIYAIYICLMGVFIFGTANIVTGVGLIAKFLVIIGGLARMTNVPSFVKSRVDTGNDIEDSLFGSVKTAKDVYDTVTLKKLKTLKFLKERK
ncbi:hypothetical protein [Metabacillus sp. Hm71]|uniref:hypothetical protein n=1 Tax=Metabacillus sp. Hm71 TaxID=3450743 RepID=UPI003F421967